MLREVEAREAATRARWGLFSPAHPPPDASWRHGDVVARASADIAAIEAETRGASARASLEARSLRLAGVAALESLVDEDTVARVWEARSQYVRWQDAAGDGVVSEGGPEGDFSPVEVNEEVAERLLDGLLTDVAHELGGACDEARRRLSWSASSERRRRRGERGGTAGSYGRRVESVGRRRRGTRRRTRVRVQVEGREPQEARASLSGSDDGRGGAGAFLKSIDVRTRTRARPRRRRTNRAGLSPSESARLVLVRMFVTRSVLTGLMKSITNSRGLKSAVGRVAIETSDDGQRCDRLAYNSRGARESDGDRAFGANATTRARREEPD